MKTKRRYVAQNVFHARTLPGLGNARITRLAAQGDAIPLRGVENKHTAAPSLSPHGTHAGRRAISQPTRHPRWPPSHLSAHTAPTLAAEPQTAS